MTIDVSERYFLERPLLVKCLAWWEDRLRPAAKRVDQGAAVTGRVKTHRSALGKIYRNPTEPRTWESLGDLVALKVILPTDRGVQTFTNWLKTQAQWDPNLEVKRCEPDELKYQSMQFDLESDECLDTNGNPIKIEVQVRSAVADAWYVVDHRLRYKGMVELPDALRRKLLRLIVLTELFDEEVEAVIAHQADLPEYGVARIYDQITRDFDDLIDGYAKSSRPEALLESLLAAYPVDDSPSPIDRLRDFVSASGDTIKAVVKNHMHGSPDFVESRDWLYYEPETLIIAERSVNRPALLRAAIANSDFESLVEPMVSEFIRAPKRIQ